jgi:hypothetical protein
MFPEERFRIATAGASREIWICTFPKVIHDTARMLGGAGFGPRGFGRATTKIRRLNPAPLAGNFHPYVLQTIHNRNIFLL